MLNDGRVWKHHLDHIRRDSMDSAVAERDSERVSQDAVPDPVPQATLSPVDPLPSPIPANMPISNPVKPGTQVGLENVNNPTPDVETPSFLGTSLSEASSFPPRSCKVRKAPDRLIETMSYLYDKLTKQYFFELRRTAPILFFT